MLTKEQNELLTRIEGETLGNKLFRQYWVPAIRSEALEADGAPQRVRLFGKNYVAFRASDGRVGIHNEACPHRGCSLLLAQNEGNGLTCIFHGWKFDVSGKTVKIPTEPPERELALCKKIPNFSYPVREAGSAVWVYLGDGEPPAFPNFEFNTLPDSHVFSRVAITNVNWLQGLEASIDTTHAGILHKDQINKMNSMLEEFGESASHHLKRYVKEWNHLAEVPHSKYDVEYVPYGLRAIATRALANNEDQYVRITEYVFPFFTFIPFGSFPKVMIAGIPIDDENTAQWFFQYNPDEPIDSEFFDKGLAGGKVNPNDFYEVKGTFENRWLQDRKKIEEGSWSGIASLILEDIIVEESMGPIVDRTKEHLGTGDKLINLTRRLCLKALNDYKEGKPPLGQNVDYSSIRALGGDIPIYRDWRDGVEQLT